MLRQIFNTTDGKFVGLIFDDEEPLMLGGFEFVPDKIHDNGSGTVCHANSNYVIYAKGI